MSGFAKTRILRAACGAALAVAIAGCAATANSGAGSTGVPTTSGATPAASSSTAPSPTMPPAESPSGVPATPAPSSATAPVATESQEPSSAVPTDGSAGWYDTWGWVSPQTAQRALAAGIAAGKDVRDELRCGTACGESPTAAEIQAQYILQHPDSPNATVEAYEAAAAACPGYFIRGNCYADAQAAQDAGEGE